MSPWNLVADILLSRRSIQSVGPWFFEASHLDAFCGGHLYDDVIFNFRALLVQLKFKLGWPHLFLCLIPIFTMSASLI